uniref:Chitin-binding protein n=1 Tax=Rhipicephalus appendiculatus TaxID=34631 RepID=A0A131YVC5_RHIAP
MINGVCSAVLVAISLAFCPTTNGQYFLGCPPVDDVHDAATILPNPYNCSTFYICAQGTPLLFRCPGHLQFNYELEVCDYPERANCFELQQYPEPVTTYLPAADFEATHVHAEKNSEPEDKAAPQPTQAQVQLTPEPHTEQPQKAVEFQSHSTAVSSEWSDTPVQTRSYDKAVKVVTVPAEPIGTTLPQPFPEQTQSVPRAEGNQKQDDSVTELASLDEAPTASVLQPQPTENSIEQELQQKIATSLPTDDLNPVTVSAPESQPEPSRQETEPKRDSEANEGASQLYHELEPTSEANIIVTDLTPQSEEKPGEMEQNAQITLDQAEAGGEQERPLSQTSPLQTLQPEPLPTQGQVPAETELPSIDFQSNSTDARREEPDHTDEPEQRQSQPENEQPEAIDDTTQAESQQTAWSAQESSVPEPEPTTVATKLELEATEKPAEFLREPSEIVEEQQSSRDITKLDDVTEAASAIEAEASEKPPQGPYELTEKPHEPEHTQEEPKPESESKQAALQFQPAATGQPITLAPEQSETQPQLEATQQPQLGLNETSPSLADAGANVEQSATELDQSEQQPTLKSAEDHTQITEVAKESQSAPETEPHESYSTGRSVEQLAVASDPSSEAGSEPQAPLDDTLETIDEPRTALTENLIDTKPLSTVSNEEADIEATEVVTAESAVTEADFALFEDQVYTANVGPEPEPEQHRDSSAIVSNALDQNTALQPSDGGAPGFENLAPTDAADRVLGAAEPTPESSFGPVMDDSLSNMENLQEETVPPPEIDDVDAAYEEKIRSDAVEIDYYS